MVRASTIGLLCAAAVALAAQSAPPAADEVPSILVSRPLLESQRLSIGDLVSLSTDAAGAHARRFRIAGEYEPMPDPMRLGVARHEVRLHLPDLMALTTSRSSPSAPPNLEEESVDAINVAVAPQDASRFARAASGRLPGVVVRSTTGDDQRAAPFIVLERFHLAIAIVTVVASSIFLLALMLMLVDERRATVGVLRLIGFRRRRILLLVLAEGVVLTAAGAIVGIVLAAALQGGVNRYFQWRYDTALTFVRITPRIALRSIAIAVPLGVVAAVASSWTLVRREVFSLTRR